MSDQLIEKNANLKGELRRRREQIERLEAQLAEQKSHYESQISTLTQQHQQELEAIEAEQNDFVQQFVDMEAERDQFKADLEAAPELYGQRATELEQQLLARDHRDAWKEHIYGKPVDEAGQVRVRDDVPLESLWRELGYTPSGDPDPAAFKQLVLKAREAKGYLFAAPTAAPAPNGATPVAKTTPPLPPGPGLDRGAPAPPENSLVVTRAQMRDPKFTTNPENAKRLQEAASKKALVIQD